MSYLLTRALERQAANASQETKDLAGLVAPHVADITVTAATGSTAAGSAANLAASSAAQSESGKEKMVQLLDSLTFGLFTPVSDYLHQKK